MEPIDRWQACLRRALEKALGPGDYTVAPCRIQGAHFYTNAAFFFPAEAVLRACPEGFSAVLQGQYVNYTVGEALLRRGVSELAARKREEPFPAPGLPSRLEALLRLREEDTAWGEEAFALAWCLAKALRIPAKERTAAMTEAFEVYYRRGCLDHDLVRALAFRFQQEG